MRRFDLDFQPRRPGLLAVVLLLAALILCLDQWLEYDRLRQQNSELQSRLEQLQQRAKRLNGQAARPESLFSVEENKALQQAVKAIRVDWEALFRHVEQASGKDISLLQIRPNVSGRTLHVGGEARNMAAALAFVDALRGAPLSDVVLISHQIKQNDAQRPIVFEIAATWQGGS